MLIISCANGEIVCEFYGDVCVKEAGRGKNSSPMSRNVHMRPDIMTTGSVSTI